jgi:hypothetical protein
MKSRDFRACMAQVANYRQTQDCMAGDAVLTAPVSKQISLQTGNFTGNLAILAAGRPDHGPENVVLQRLLGQFPTPTNREFYLANRVSSGA